MKKQTKIKKFFKRIEGFFVRIKQRYIVHHLLKTGGQEIYNPQIEMFAHFKTKSSFHKTKRII